MKYFLAAVALFNWIASLLLWMKNGEAQSYGLGIDIWAACCLVIAYMEAKK